MLGNGTDFSVCVRIHFFSLFKSPDEKLLPQIRYKAMCIPKGLKHFCSEIGQRF